MRRLNRKALFTEVEDIISTYCEGCFLHKHMKEEKGRRRAHRFCITQCTIGEQLKTIGKELS